jgi:hypothetical protein
MKGKVRTIAISAFATIVALAMTFSLPLWDTSLKAGAAKQTEPVKFDAELNKWVEDNLLPKMPDPRVTWDGVVVISDLGSKIGVATYTPVFGGWGRIVGIRINLEIDRSLTREERKVTALKDIYGNYVFFTWWLDNRSYISYGDRSFISFVDGMGYNFVTDMITPSWSFLVKWGGSQIPTCEHLRAVQELYSRQMVSGRGVGELLKKNRCSADK